MLHLSVLICFFHYYVGGQTRNQKKVFVGEAGPKGNGAGLLSTMAFLRLAFDRNSGFVIHKLCFAKDTVCIDASSRTQLSRKRRPAAEKLRSDQHSGVCLLLRFCRGASCEYPCIDNRHRMNSHRIKICICICVATFINSPSNSVSVLWGQSKNHMRRNTNTEHAYEFRKRFQSVCVSTE